MHSLIDRSVFSLYHILEALGVFSATNCTLRRQHLCELRIASKRDNDDMSHAETHITSHYLKKKGYQNHKPLSGKGFKNGSGYTR